MSVKYVYFKGFSVRIHKEHLQLSNKKSNEIMGNRTEHFSKKIRKWQISSRKAVRHYSESLTVILLRTCSTPTINWL